MGSKPCSSSSRSSTARFDWFSFGLRQRIVLVDHRDAQGLVFAVRSRDFDEGVDLADGRDVGRDEGLQLRFEFVDFRDVAGQTGLLRDVLEEVLHFCRDVQGFVVGGVVVQPDRPVSGSSAPSSALPRSASWPYTRVPPSSSCGGVGTSFSEASLIWCTSSTGWFRTGATSGTSSAVSRGHLGCRARSFRRPGRCTAWCLAFLLCSPLILVIKISSGV